MKSFIFFITILVYSQTIGHAQTLTRTIDSFTGDSIITTGFDTLSRPKTKDSLQYADRFVAVKTVHKNTHTYWLFFYFPTSDIASKSISITSKKYAYFVTTRNQYIRLPYTGKAFTYSAKENAGFFINVTAYLTALRSSEFKIIRFETSQLYHEVIVPAEKMMDISNALDKLIN